MTLDLPADIRDLDEDEFVLGSSPDDEDERELDIDDIFGKDLEDVLADSIRYRGAKCFDPETFELRTQSDVDPELTFVTSEYGTLLLDSEEAIIGGFIETDLVLDDNWQGQGLGKELVVEHFLRSGDLPTWYLDSAQYSSAGYNTCCSAHRYPREEPETYVGKLVRHIVEANPGVADGMEEQLTSILRSKSVEHAREEITELLAPAPAPSV